ncbi:hypothetical protein Pres01_20740 [Metapseudomonas resinovorans]|uniref:hypothetical protein n=1 Tax=Metapseudomonas resinovorans TaxID=53412 RepID=UPI0009873DDC|nr:hypothetical protein [Pseudomonas resinovorans]GLZ86023.1 hypothetical protein Pres01_20740 [Pseudomonas resinovorans]
MKALKLTILAGFLVIGSGCASGLNSQQKTELRNFESRGLSVEEKNPGAGAALGLLPGGGSFYGREYGFGAINLLLWPISILWDPVSGYNAAESINYYSTKEHVRQLRKNELDGLDEELKNGSVDLKAYALEKSKIDAKYLMD